MEPNLHSTTRRYQWQEVITAPRLILLLIILGTAVVQSINLFGFPSYREDEGTYMSQAWSVIHLQRLAPYTYWYDHAPLGWLIIALWTILFGDVPVAGILVNNGRIFMMVVQVISAALVYAIAQRMTKKTWIALLATTLFSFSPINIVFHRQVLLDNIMAMWLLTSLYLITGKITLRKSILSALFFGFAVLCKETAIVLLPWLIILVARLSHPLNRRLVIVTWLSVAILSISLYPLFATLKGELFPTGTWIGGDNPHVSLWDALTFQWARSRSEAFTETFAYAWSETWGRYGAWLIILGACTTLYHLWRYREPWLFALGGMAWTIIFTLLRGQILDWYIIPLFPIFSLSIAFICGQWPEAPRLFKKVSPAVIPISAAILLVATAYNLWQNSYIFTTKQTKNQKDAIAWVKDNLLGEGVLLTDNYAFIDLNPGLTSVASAQAHYYWKVDTDPEIKNDILNNDWNSIDYLLITPAMVRTMYADNLYFVQQAYKNSHIVQWFRYDNEPPLAYPVEIREVNNSHGVIQSGWRAYREAFITPEGRVIDRTDIHGTTSEAQSYAMLRAVWEDDQATYDRLWQWTSRTMKRRDNNLFGWLYSDGLNGRAGTLETATATDADEDIALSLLFASARWQDLAYSEAAKKIITDIWKYSVINVQSNLYLTSSAHSSSSPSHLINPSYLSPATYRIFATIDPTHPWLQLADDSYSLLNKLSVSNDTGDLTPQLIPNWISLTPKGEITPVHDKTITDAPLYGYDAFRIYWRVALDAVWFDNPDARAFLKQSRAFFKPEWEQNRRIAALYSVDGEPQASFEDLSTYAGALSVLFVTDPEDAIDMYTAKLWPRYNKGFWGDPKNYYNQNWAWFASALYANNVPNLWSGDPTVALAK